MDNVNPSFHEGVAGQAFHPITAFIRAGAAILGHRPCAALSTLRNLKARYFAVACL